MDWCLYGDDKRKEMDRDLKPEYLFLDDFGGDIRMYLAKSLVKSFMLEDIR